MLEFCLWFWLWCLQTRSSRKQGPETWYWEKRCKRITSHSCTWCQCWTGLVNTGMLIVSCYTNQSSSWRFVVAVYVWYCSFCWDQLIFKLHEYLFQNKLFLDASNLMCGIFFGETMKRFIVFASTFLTHVWEDFHVK